MFRPVPKPSGPTVKWVRPFCQAAGFAVDKRPGHGAKRERLEAHYQGEPQAAAALPTVAVIGAGIAGASLVRALTALGLDPVVAEAEGPGAGASGNPAALVTPALDAGGGARARLYAQAFARAVDLYRAAAPAVIAGEGVLQLEAGERDGPRFDSVMAGDVFAPGALARLSPAQATAALGHPAEVGALRFAEGLVIHPPALLDAWLGGARRIAARVASLQRRETGGWTLLDDAGAILLQADVVCLAAGAGHGHAV